MHTLHLAKELGGQLKQTAEPLTRCPECEGHVRRLIQPAGIVFKGCGWYVAESRKMDERA